MKKNNGAHLKAQKAENKHNELAHDKEYKGNKKTPPRFQNFKGEPIE